MPGVVVKPAHAPRFLPPADLCSTVEERWLAYSRSPAQERGPARGLGPFVARLRNSHAHTESEVRQLAGFLADAKEAADGRYEILGGDLAAQWANRIVRLVDGEP